MNKRHLIALASALVLLPGAASAKDDYVYGPAPAWGEYKRLGEAALRERLPDPDGWSIEWANGYKQGVWPGHGHPQGYLTCGIARAVKPFEGGYPRYPFVVVIDRGVVKGVDFEARPRSLPALICPSVIERGGFPTAAAMEAGGSSPANGGAQSSTTSTAAMAIAGRGLTIRQVSEGAYVTSVEPGSSAAKAGLVPGTVIVRANGIALAGLGTAMSNILSADVPDLSIETAAGAHLSMRK